MLLSNLINGVIQERISVQDRGFLYGDGLFEAIAVRAGSPEHWHHHMRRLEYGSRCLGISMPEAALLEAEARQLC